MANSNKKQSSGFISSAFGVAKKLSETGLSVVNHVAPGTVSKLTQSPKQEQVVQGSSREKSAFERKKYDNPQQMFREHLPTVTGKLLGKHYKKINNVASFISPDLNDKLSDFLFDKLNDFVSELSSVEAVLKEVGAKNLSELAKDPSRSQRISTALANQTKIIAAIQGALTGGIGGIGAIIDVPTSLALALRSVYQTGRAHGFELKAKDQAVVEYIFKQIDLGAVAEKQALMAAIRTFAGVLETHNVSQLQQLLGSENDAELIKKWIANEDGSFKLNWLNQIPQFGLLKHLTPFATIGISAVYSWKLVDDATDKAEVVFFAAQQYLLTHPDENIDVLDAFEKSQQSVTDIEPALLTNVQAKQPIQEKSIQADSTVEELNTVAPEDATPIESIEKSLIKEAKVSEEELSDEKFTQKGEDQVEQNNSTEQSEKTENKSVPVTPKVIVKNNITAENSDASMKTSATAKTVTKKSTQTKPKATTSEKDSSQVKAPESTEKPSESDKS